jgi:uncharacterized protein (TIGR00290 family)
MARNKVVVAWSSGKDSAWTLHRLRSVPDTDVIGLLTTFSEADDAVTMHGVPRRLARRQAKAADLPLVEVFVPWPCPNPIYEARMGAAVTRMKAMGATQVAFGDLFLEDVRRWREERLAGSGLAPLFPLWGQATAGLAAEMIAGGLQAVLTCVDTRRLPAGLAGRRFDRDLLEALPAGVDPCGENGEFHSFVTAGPMLAAAIPVTTGSPMVDAQGFARVRLAAA